MIKRLIFILLFSVCVFGQNTVCFEIELNPNIDDPAFQCFSKYVNVLDCFSVYAESNIPDNKVLHVAAIAAQLLDNNVNFSDLESLAYKSEKSLLKEVNLFDVYEGKELPKGKKSYALSFILSDSEKTLTEDSIDNIMSNILTVFQEKLGAEIRS